VKVGVTAAALFDMGTSVIPKDIYPASLMADLFGLLATVFWRATEEPKPDGWAKAQDDQIRREHLLLSGGRGFDLSGDDDDDDPVSVMAKMKSVWTQFKVIVKKHKVQLCVVTLGALCGVLIYLIQHHVIEFEGKGKTKTGRGMKHAKGGLSNKRIKKRYVVYDDNSIVDMFRNGIPINIVQGDQEDGDYVIVRFINGKYVEEEFTVDHNAQYDADDYHGFRTESVLFEYTGLKSQKILAHEQLTLSTPKCEALIATSPTFKHDVVSQAGRS